MINGCAIDLAENLASSAKMGNVEGSLPAIIDMLSDIYIPHDTTQKSIILPTSGRFGLWCEDPGVAHTLTPARLIINRNLVYRPQGLLSKAASAIKSVRGYSTEQMLRLLETDEEAVAEVVDSKRPFSILSRFRSVDYDGTKDQIEIGPVITTVRGSRDAIDNWQARMVR